MHYYSNAPDIALDMKLLVEYFGREVIRRASLFKFSHFIFNIILRAQKFIKSEINNYNLFWVL
jgi:hypothetical protein